MTEEPRRYGTDDPGLQEAMARLWRAYDRTAVAKSQPESEGPRYHHLKLVVDNTAEFGD